MVPNYVRSLFLGFTGLLLAACAAPSAAPVAFTATDGAFSGPAELPSGWTEITLTNNGQEPHHLQLVRLDAGRSVEELGATLSESGGAFLSWGRPFGGLNTRSGWHDRGRGEPGARVICPDRRHPGCRVCRTWPRAWSAP
jgi:hypothetical protein